MTTKTRSIRLETEMFEKIDEKCKGLGCNGNDFIKEAIIEKLNGTNSKIQKIQENEPKIEVKDPPKLKIEVLLDKDIKDPSKVMHFRYAGNGKYIQEGVEEGKGARLENID